MKTLKAHRNRHLFNISDNNNNKKNGIAVNLAVIYIIIIHNLINPSNKNLISNLLQ